MSSSSSSSNEIAHESKNETGREIRGYYFDAKQNRYFKRTNEHRYGADSKRQKREAQSSCRFNATRLLLHRELRPTSMARYQFEICTHSANSIRRLEWTMNGSAQRERTIQQLAVQEERILYTCSDGTVNLAAFDFARNDDRNDDDVTLFNVWQRRIGDGSSLGTLSWRGPAFVHDQWFAMSVLGGPRGASGYGAVIRGRDGVVQLRMPCHAKAGQAPASCFTCAWSPSGGALALGASRAAKVYDLTNGDGQVRDVFVGSRADVLAVAFGSGGGGDKLLSVGTRAGHLYADVDLRARGQPRRSDARQHGSDSITWLRSLSPSSSSLPFATVLAATRWRRQAAAAHLCNAARQRRQRHGDADRRRRELRRAHANVREPRRIAVALFARGDEHRRSANSRRAVACRSRCIVVVGYARPGIACPSSIARSLLVVLLQ
jgi:hypothetical protein